MFGNVDNRLILGVFLWEHVFPAPAKQRRHKQLEREHADLEELTFSSSRLSENLSRTRLSSVRLDSERHSESQWQLFLFGLRVH